MNNYLDNLMINHSLTTESVSTQSEDNIESKNKKKKKIKQKGGEENNLNIPYIPHGGFPPLYICDQIKQEKEQTKEREYSTHKTSVSIKDIMKSRRDITPFIPQ